MECYGKSAHECRLPGPARAAGARGTTSSPSRFLHNVNLCIRHMVSPPILLGAPEAGNNVKLEVVGSGQVYPLVEVTLL